MKPHFPVRWMNPPCISLGVLTLSLGVGGAIAQPATAAIVNYSLSGQLSTLELQGNPINELGSLKRGDALFGKFSYDDAIDPVATYGLEPGQVLLTTFEWGNGKDFFAKATPTVPATYDLKTGSIIYPNPRSTAQFPNNILLAPLSANVKTSTFSYFDRAIGAKGSFVATRVQPVPEAGSLSALLVLAAGVAGGAGAKRYRQNKLQNF